MSIPTTRPLTQIPITDEDKSEWKDHFTAVRNIFWLIYITYMAGKVYYG